MNDIASANAFARIIRAGDSRRFGIDLKASRDSIIASALQDARGSTPILEPFTTTNIRGKNYVSYQRYNDHLILRSITRHLKRKLRISMPDRNRITLGVVQALLDGTPMVVIRRDISSFYESINSKIIQEKVLYDTATTPLAGRYLRHYFDQHRGAGSFGVPRGIALSSLLAELYMKEFDQKVRELPGVYRYFRYADDILVFTTDGKASEALGDLLPDGMTFNRAKHERIDIQSPTASMKKIEYLGYIYEVEDVSKKRSVRVGISSRKISKIKSRIIKSVRNFSETPNFSDLFNRISFLSSNYEIKREGISSNSESNRVRCGIYYNYSHCGHYKIGKSGKIERETWPAHSLRELDGFTRALLFGPSSKIAKSFKRNFTSREKSILLKLSFYAGFHSKMTSRYRPHEIAGIKSVWRHA